jgi:hypothetical protein
MDQRLPVFCFWFGTVLSAVAQQPSSANPLNDLLTMQMNWDASKSNDNATPSTTLKFVPYEQHKQDGKSFTSYYLYAPGLSSAKPYTMIAWQIGWDAQLPPMNPTYSDLYVNARGVVMCRKPSEEEMNQDAPSMDSDARLNLISAGSMGEPVRYALYAEKDGMVAMGRLIVNPIESADKSCHLQAILAVGGGQVMLLEGAGFTPKAAVELSSLTSGKPKTAKFKTDERGRLETAVVLMKPGETQGSATITMKSDSCAPTVKFNWGSATYKVQ